MTANVTLRYVLLYGVGRKEMAAALDWTSRALAEGALSALPVHRFGLEEISAAQDAVERGAVGKVLVIPGGAG